MTECLEKKVLFVDDDDGFRQAFEMFLKPRFKEVHVAKDGEEGLARYKEIKPDMVITDIEMPKMNGIELLDSIKKLNHAMPVIIVTAFRDEAHKAEGADAILVKPVDKKDLIETLRNHCEKNPLKGA